MKRRKDQSRDPIAGISGAHSVDWSFLRVRGLRTIAEHWEELRGPNLIPLRSDYRMYRHPILALRTVILERVAYDKWRFFYAGHRELQGDLSAAPKKNLLDLCPEPLKSDVFEILDATMNAPCAFASYYHSKKPGGAEYVVRTINLPFQDAKGEVKYLMTVSDIERKKSILMNARTFFENLLEYQYTPINIGAGLPQIKELRHQNSTIQFDTRWATNLLPK